MKVVFMGTPEFGVEVLKHLVNSNHEVVAVVCATDKQAGRGKKLVSPPVKIFAQQNNLPVYQFEKVSKQGVEVLQSLGAHVFVTAAFGQILSKQILSLAPYGTLNVHGSLLPKYRGAAPVQYAILNGETLTGVTIMQTDVGVDDGDILLQESLQISPEDTTDTLMAKLANLGGQALVKTLDLLEQGKITPKKQNHAFATKTKMLKKENAFINFNLPAQSVVNFVRAYFSNPVARFVYKGQQIKVTQAKVADLQNLNTQNFAPGQVVVSNPKQGLVIACKQGFVEIVNLQAENTKVMSAKAYLNGKKIEVGTVLG